MKTIRNGLFFMRSNYQVECICGACGPIEKYKDLAIKFWNNPKIEREAFNAAINMDIDKTSFTWEAKLFDKYLKNQV